MTSFIGFFARRVWLAEREGLSGNLIRSPYISEKSCDCGGLRDTSRTTSQTTFCRAQIHSPKMATTVKARNIPPGFADRMVKALSLTSTASPAREAGRRRLVRGLLICIRGHDLAERR